MPNGTQLGADNPPYCRLALLPHSLQVLVGASGSGRVNAGQAEARWSQSPQILPAALRSQLMTSRSFPSAEQIRFLREATLEGTGMLHWSSLLI